jgi:hypothetical protein
MERISFHFRDLNWMIVHQSCYGTTITGKKSLRNMLHRRGGVGDPTLDYRETASSLFPRRNRHIWEWDLSRKSL